MEDGVLLTKPMCEGDSDENGQHIIDRVVEQDICLVLLPLGNLC